MRDRTIRRLLPLVVVVVAGAAAATAALASTHASNGTVRAIQSKSFGMVLVGPNGHTLYRYTPDRKGVSVCKGTCLQFWPPLLVKAGTKPTVGAGAVASLIGTIKAAGGKLQVTYAGFPLYTFARDTKAGQASGEGFGAKWYVVNTKGALVKHAVTTSSSSGGTSSGSSWG